MAHAAPAAPAVRAPASPGRAPSPSPTDRRDALVHGGCVYVGDEAGTVDPDGAVLVLDGTVAAVGTTAEVGRAVEAARAAHRLPRGLAEVDARGAMVLPGLVNAHWHDMFAMRMPFKGALRTAHDRDDRPAFLAAGGDLVGITRGFDRFADLMGGLRPDEAEAISAYALSTQLRSGVTTVGDTSSFTRPPSMAAAARRLGVRLSISTWACDGHLDDAGRFVRTRDADAVLAEVEDVVALAAADGTGRLRARPSTVYALSMSDELGAGLAELCLRHDLPAALHVAALRHEVPATEVAFGQTPVRRLARLGLLERLGHRLMAVHASHLDADEQRLLLAAGTHLSISPAKYGSAGETTLTETGAVRALRRAGLTVSLSTDGAPLPVGGMVENMAAAWQAFGEMSGDPTELLPTAALAMATRLPAYGLDWPGIGTLEPGARGDLAIVAADDWRFLLNPRPLEALLHLGGSADVRTVLVDGAVRVRDGLLTGVDERALEDDYLSALESFSVRCLDVPPEVAAAVVARGRGRAER